MKVIPTELVNCIPSPALILNKNGQILATNSETDNVFGYERMELSGLNLNVLIPENNRDYFQDLIANLNQLPMGQERVLSWRRKDGSDIKVEVFLKVFDSDRMDIIASVKDVSEREIVKNNLEISQAINKTGTWYYDLINDKVWWSAELFRMFKLPVSQYAPDYETHAALFKETSRKTLDDAVSRAIEKGIPYEIELELATTNNDSRFAIARCEPQIGTDGKVVKLVGTFQDVTAIKQVEYELSRTTVRLNESVKASGIGIWEWDLSTDELIWDTNMCRIYGITKSSYQTTVDLWKNALHPDDAIFAISAIEAALDGGPKYDIEFRIVTADGNTRWVKGDATILRDEITGDRRVVGTNQDITEQKLTSNKIKELEKRNRALLDYSPVCHMIVDLDFKLRYMNRNGFNMLNLPENEERYGQPYPFDFFQLEVKELMKAQLQWVKDNGERQTFESRARTVDGQEVWLLCNLIPVPNENGDMDYITVVSADISQRKQQENQLLNTQKVSLAGQLSAGICHDLNNVLNIISSNAELIGLKQKTQDISIYSEKIIQGITRAKNVTDRLLKLAKPREESIKNVDLDTVIRGELQFYKDALPNTINIDVSFNAGASVAIDENTFDDAVMNLIVNAQKALTDDGVIHISTYIESFFNAQSSYIHCEPDEANEYAVLSIKDNGKGIPAHKLDEVFLPFVSERYDSGGTGLGLAVVSAFAINNKAGLTVNTEEGKGTEFTFWFPIHASDEPNGANTSIKRGSAISGRTIVIIDDEKDLLDAFVDMLEIADANVVGFHNPDEAKHHIEQRSDDIDIVISDQSLGHQIKGSDVVKWINIEYPRIRCFISTGYSADINLEGLNMEIIEKPATLAKVIEQIS